MVKLVPSFRGASRPESYRHGGGSCTAACYHSDAMTPATMTRGNRTREFLPARGRMHRISGDAAAVALIVLVCCAAGTGGEQHRCDLPLGVSDGSIPDSAITSSLANNPPRGVRLNQDSAWCYNMSSLAADQQVTVTLDLGRVAFVSGVQMQGPPLSMQPITYVHYVPFRVINTTTPPPDAGGGEDEWTPCCGERTFFTNDMHAEVGVVTTYPFGQLVLARQLQFQFDTGINTGGDTKCYRLEVLGCPQDVVPATNLTLTAVPSGWLETVWKQSTVQIPTSTGSTSLNLNTPHYEVRTDRWGTSLPNETTVQFVDVARVLLPNPVWGARYRVHMTCIHQGVPLPCGTTEIQAVLTEGAPETDELVFRRPQPLKGAVVQEGASAGVGSLVLWWQAAGNGWVTPTNTLLVKDTASAVVFRGTQDSQNTTVVVDGLTEGATYSVDFIPVTDLQQPPTFTYPLYLIQWETVTEASTESGFGAFLADLSLDANVLWNGTLRVTWTPGVVQGTEQLPSPQVTTTGTNAPTTTTTTASTTIAPTTTTTTTPPTTTSTLTTTTSTAATSTVTAAATSENASETTTDATAAGINDAATDVVTTETESSVAGDTTSTASDDVSGTSSQTSPAAVSPTATTPPPAPTTTTIPPRLILSAHATAYNITLLLDGQVVNSSLVSGETESLLVDFSMLKLEKEYTVEVLCHLGGLVVDCSSTTASTDLPLTWTNSEEGGLAVFVAQEVGAGWRDQKERCSRSSSQLVTLATKEKEALFTSALHDAPNTRLTKQFWLGSSFCTDNNGKMWVDSSAWQYALFPDENSGVSSTTCCVKAVNMAGPKEPLDFIWKGDECGALLPTVCEHRPAGLVGVFTTLARNNATKTTASVSLAFEQLFWVPTYLSITFCPTRDLATAVDINKNSSCLELEVLPNDTLATAKDLLLFTEYRVTGQAVLQTMDYEGVAVTTLVRTFPDSPVVFNVLDTGKVSFIWAQKVAEFGENYTVSVELRGGSSSAPDPTMATLEKQVLATGTSLGPLALGQAYHLVMQEKQGVEGNQPRTETVDFTAYPKCSCSGCQLDQFCFQASPTKVPAAGPSSSSSSSSSSSCPDPGARLTTIEYNTTLQFVLQMAVNLGDDLWVSADSKLGTGKAPPSPTNRVSASLTIETDAEVVPEVSSAAQQTTLTPTTITNNNNMAASDCKLVSRAMKEVVMAPCTELHFTACSSMAPIGHVFPPKDELTIATGDSWIKIGWNSSFSSWKARYSVEYQRTRDKRSKRQINVVDFDSPPVTIEGLQDDMSYNLQLVGDMGGGYVHTSDEFQVITGQLGSSSYSQQLGVAGVGWSQSGDIYVLQLFAGSFLVACCIATMLLFFSTGMFYQDCMAQLGFLATLLTAYFLLMLAHPPFVNEDNLVGCSVLSVVLHMLFLSSFMFLTLECHALSFLLVNRISNPFQKTNWLLVLLGLLVPTMFVLITGGVINKSYVDSDNHNCWLDATGPAVYVEVIPKAVLVVAAVALLVMTFTTTEDLPDLVELDDLRGRQSDCRKLRWVIGLEVLLLSLAWSSGVAAYQTKTVAAHVIFAIATLLLAIVILTCRTYFDETFRSKWHRLCCGTELTYKRSDLVGLSGRNRVSPHHVDMGRPDRSSQTSSAQTMDYTMPHTPPQGDKTVLVRRTYNFGGG